MQRLRSTSVLLTILSALACATNASAQELVDAESAQRSAMEHAPDVVLALSRAATAETEVGVAGMLLNPKLTVGTTSGSAMVYGNLYVTLPLFGQRGTAMDAAQAQARVMAAGAELAKLDARLAVSFAWLAAWQADAELRIARDNAARRDRLLESAQARFSEGAAPRLDVLRAETEARRMHAEVNALLEQQRGAYARLAVFLGAAVDARFVLHGEPRLGDPSLAPLDLDALVTKHPLTERARALIHAADAVLSREERARWPLLGVQVGGNFLERYPPPSNEVTVAVTVELPVFNGALIARAEATRSTATVERNAVTAQLRATLAGALADYSAAVSRHEAQLHQVAPAAREAAELALEAYQSGGLDLTATLAAEQALSDARLAAARFTADRARAFATLEHAAGRAL